MTAQKVINENYCVNCGGCVVANPEKYIRISPQLIKHNKNIDDYGVDVADRVCPQINGVSDDLLFNSSINTDKIIGNYIDVNAGWVNNINNRQRSSSGGLGYSIVREALESKIVDAVIAVAYSPDDPDGVEYKVITSIEGLESSRQSKYITRGFEKAIMDAVENKLKFIFTGVPCQIRAVRLLAKNNEQLGRLLVATVAIFCGHQKTNSFYKYIAWRSGVNPENIKDFRYRVKKHGRRADKYYYGVSKKDVNEVSEIRVDKVRWLDWGIGLFKLRGCDYCSNVFAEDADIVLGDAWLEKYVTNAYGTNVVITRSEFGKNIIAVLLGRGEITLDKISADMVVQSQIATLRHRTQGLAVRLNAVKDAGQWAPTCSGQDLPLIDEISPARKLVYLLRRDIAESSEVAFNEALLAKDIKIFDNAMEKQLMHYERVLRSEVGFTKKIKMFIRSVLDKIID